METTDKKDHVHSMDEIVFEQRNKSYGAYFLRRRYSDYVVTATLIAVALFSIILISPVAYSKFFGKQQDIENLKKVTVIMEDLDLPETPPEVAPPPVELPKISQIEHLEPEIKPDP